MHNCLFLSARLPSEPLEHELVASADKETSKLVTDDDGNGVRDRQKVVPPVQTCRSEERLKDWDVADEK